MKIYKVNAIEKRNYEQIIVANSEEEAIDIMVDMVEDNSIFDNIDNNESEYISELIGTTLDEQMDENCEGCEYFCPCCGECIYDE